MNKEKRINNLTMEYDSMMTRFIFYKIFVEHFPVSHKYKVQYLDLLAKSIDFLCEYCVSQEKYENAWTALLKEGNEHELFLEHFKKYKKWCYKNDANYFMTKTNKEKRKVFFNYLMQNFLLLTYLAEQEANEVVDEILEKYNNQKKGEIVCQKQDQ